MSGVRIVKLEALSFMDGQLQAKDEHDRPIHAAEPGEFVSIDLPSFMLLIDRVNSLIAETELLRTAIASADD